MAKGSLRHIRCYVNDPALRPHLDALLFTASPTLAAQATGRLAWVSPLAGEAYKEYSDAGFLRACGLGPDACASLQGFWPPGGPEWDALATVPLATSEKGVVLVEAKAHLGELKERDATGAVGDSLTTIMKSLEKVREYLGVPASARPWHEAYYQVCNRLAHLYFLNEELRVPAWMVWVLIIDAPEWSDRAGPWEWAEHFATTLAAIGLPSTHPLQDRIAVAFVPAAPEPAVGLSCLHDQ
jgi:hypothetical protein